MDKEEAQPSPPIPRNQKPEAISSKATPPPIVLETPAEKIAAVREILAKHFPGFEIDEHNGPVIDAISLYMFNDPAFEKISPEICANPSLRKGILIGGPVGTGKSLLLKIFADISNKFNPFHVKRYSFQSTRSVVGEYRDKLRLKEPVTLIRELGLKDFRKLNDGTKEPRSRCFDGIGEELMNGPIRDYGNTLNVFMEILADRYDMFIDHGMLTHGSTNCDAGELEEFYSLRMLSRFRQMFNSFELKGRDRRPDGKIIRLM
jgi:hypothetical protein